MKVRNQNRPRHVAISPMPLPRPRKRGLGRPAFAVNLEGGPFHGQRVMMRASSCILAIRVRGGIYLPSGKFSAFGQVAA